MAEINRSLIIVKAKEPFLDWVRTYIPESENLTLEELNDEPTAFLIPEYETDEEQEEIINWCAEYVFEYELWSWCTDETEWPTGRDAAMFREWFDVKFLCMVDDVVGDIPLKHGNFDDDLDDEDLDEIDPDSNGH